MSVSDKQLGVTAKSSTYSSTHLQEYRTQSVQHVSVLLLENIFGSNE